MTRLILAPGAKMVQGDIYDVILLSIEKARNFN
jgi:hypothetical protein